MPLSGDTVLSLTGGDMVLAVLRKVGIGQGKTIADLPAYQVSDTLQAINIMLKSWRDRGVIPTLQDWTVQNQNTDSTYVTGTDSNVYKCLKGLTSAAANEPITGANWQEFWFESANATPATWASGQSYVSIGDFAPPDDTQEIIEAFVRWDNYDYPLRVHALAQYLVDETLKANYGLPIDLYFENGADSTGTLVKRCFFWPMPDLMTYQINYLRIRAIQNIDTVTDEIDLPSFWYEAMVFNAALRMSFDFQLSVEEKSTLAQMATDTFKVAKIHSKPITTATSVEPCFQPPSSYMGTR